MTYRILRITEDDYGCEERLDDAPEMVRCLIEDGDGVSFWKSVEESLLTELGLDEGSSFDQNIAERLDIYII